MEKQELLFVGFREFESKKGKKCFLLNFLTKPINYEGGCFCKPVSIFTTASVYDSFVKEFDIMQWTELDYEIVGDQVRYKI